MIRNKVHTVFLFIVALIFLFSCHAYSYEIYLKPTGTRTSGVSNNGDWSDSNCYSTISAAFSASSGGDTITIDDGVYPAITDNYINQYNYPKSGNAQQFTVIKARNIPGQNGIPINSGLRVKIMAPMNNSNYPSNNTAIYVKYIKWEGIQFAGVSTYTNWDYNYFKQCAVQGMTDGNTVSWSINGQYNLLEDCVAYGKGRYKFLFYEQSREQQLRGDNNNVCRRCVARQDWSNKNNTLQNPIAGMASYYARGTVFLNSIVIDGNTPEYWMQSPGEISGAFYLPNDDGPHKLTIKGSIAINNAYSAIVMRVLSSYNSIEDFVGINNAGGIYGLGESSIANRIAIYNSGTNLFTYRADTQILQNLGANNGLNGYTGYPSTAANSIISGVNCAVSGAGGNAITANYVDYYNNGNNESCVSGIGSLGVDQLSINPLSNGWMYPVRVEANSTLASSGLSGGQVGPNIMYKLGKDGTFKGDADWDTPQGNLWPFPMEEWVQAQMRSMDTQIWSDGTGQVSPYDVGHYDTMPDPYRGFCAEGQTLTKYIWESLGNQIPDDIYVGVIPGTCGASNGLALSSAPVTNLCSAGTASAVSGTGPWSWTCAGSDGGSTANCGATLASQARSISVKLGSGGKMTGILR